MAVIIPNVTNWSVTPQNGNEDYFTKMNVWLSESTTVIASLSTAITKINESNAESNDNLDEVLIARDQTVAARNEAVTAVATLTAGAIDNTTIASNKAFSNQYIQNNYYNKTEIDNKTNINGFTDKPTPIDTDHIALQETGGLFKKLSFANLKATLKTYFDALYLTPLNIVDKLGINNLLHIQDQKVAGTNGQTILASTLTTRDLNTVITNNISGASLSANTVTLPAGTYFVDIKANIHGGNNGKCTLRNNSDNTVLLASTNTQSNSTNTTSSTVFLTGIITLPITTTIKLSQISLNASYSGVAYNVSSPEIYTDLKIWKVA